MKRKVISLITALACACVCAVGLAACGEQDTLRWVSIGTMPGNGVEIEITEQNADEKFLEYNIVMSYGNSFGAKDVELSASYSQDTKTLSLKTASNPDGYEIEGAFPDNPAPGKYAVKYLYGDWTVKVNFIVNKLKVPWPDFESYYHYWTGSVVKPELLGDSEYITYDHNYGKTEVGDYTLEIELKDDVNCEWDATYGTGEVVTGTRVINWSILKETYVVDRKQVLTGGDESLIYVNSEYYEYAYDGTAKEFPINEAALKDIKDKITIEIKNGEGVVVTEMKNVGIYFLYLRVNDTEHTRIKEKSDMADGWDSVCIGTLKITE